MTAGTVAVEQVDREAAANWRCDTIDADMSTSDYAGLVQAFAAHRLAAASAQPGVVKGDYNGTTEARIRAGEQMHFTESRGLWAAMLGGSVQYQAWTPDESKVRGFSEGYNLALRHMRFAYPNLTQAPLSTRQGEAVREAAAIAARDALCDYEWPPQDGDAQIDAVMARIRAMPLPIIASEDRGEVERPYLADRFEWAAPGDQQEDAWLVRFCDKDCGEAIFTGPDAERDAWEHWNRYAPSYNIYVFRLARLSPNAITDDGARGLDATEALAWLGTDQRLSLYHYAPIYGDDDDQREEWRVDRESGNINDREWTTIGRGATPLDALRAAAPHANVEKEAGNG